MHIYLLVGIRFAIFAQKHEIYCTMITGEIIRERRISIGLTQQEVADYAGVSLRMLVGFENGRANPSLKTIEAIADVLGLEVVLKIKEIDA